MIWFGRSIRCSGWFSIVVGFVILVSFMRQHVRFDRGIVFHVMSVAYIVCNKASQIDLGHLTLSILRLAALDEARKTHNTIRNSISSVRHWSKL